jgi:hypothetical protein
MMKAFTFSEQPNSYFNGHDLRIGRQDDGRVITTNRRNDYWVLNVKSDWVRSQRSLAVQTAAANLTDLSLESYEEESKEFFWREAEHLAVTHGFNGTVYQEGRSGGWLAVEETNTFEALHPMQAINKEEQAAIENWLAFCFDAIDLQEKAEEKFDADILEANQELQVELSEYVDWIGGSIESLDGYVAVATNLEVRNGKAAIGTEAWFSFANEAKLVRKSDGSVPSRLTADPIMEQVFQIIEARGDVSGAQVNEWLDASDDNDPSALYQEHVASAVNAIEDEIKEATA